MPVYLWVPDHYYVYIRGLSNIKFLHYISQYKNNNDKKEILV